MMIAPVPQKTRAKVPIISAAYFFIVRLIEACGTARLIVSAQWGLTIL
jgi:hypothetical protein